MPVQSPLTDRVLLSQLRRGSTNSHRLRANFGARRVATESVTSGCLPPCGTTTRMPAQEPADSTIPFGRRRQSVNCTGRQAACCRQVTQELREPRRNIPGPKARMRGANDGRLQPMQLPEKRRAPSGALRGSTRCRLDQRRRAPATSRPSPKIPSMVTHRPGPWNTETAVGDAVVPVRA